MKLKLNPLMAAGFGLGFSLIWATPTLAALTDTQNFGIEVKATGQMEDDRDLGTRSGGDVNGVGLDLRPWAYGEWGNWSGYAMGQVVTATDTIQTDPLDQQVTDANGQSAQRSRSTSNSRKVDDSYAALREFWIGYRGFTPYPGEILKVGRQRLRNDDGQWHDTNIEAVNWTFDTTLLKAEVGAAQRFSEYRTDLTELSAQDKDRSHLYGDVEYQWTPGQWAGVRAHHSHDGGSLKQQGSAIDDLDKTSRGDLTWLGLQANSDAYNYRNLNTVNYWGSLTWLTGDRDRIGTTYDPIGDQYVAGEKNNENVNGWATDLGLRFRLDPMWQVGGAYSRASKNYEQNGLESNRSNWTGTRSRVHRFGEAFQGEMANVESGSLFASWQMQDEYDASLIYHKFRRVDGHSGIGGAGINPAQENVDDDGVSTFASLPLEDGRKDLGQEMDLVVTKYFKQGLLPAAVSQSFDEPSALIRLRAGVFKPGDAYHSGVDDYMHRAIVDVIWRF
ncbi:alginate export family protein [Pseudomonas petrae]|uniref:Alginate export family protein n=1 Tax=Pseudomonas petrae TaxID=2912190 RepID=A0ABS9I0R1_9PSED|nr:alginate export family protein [Pseudomonas petrae]MCF7533283.1 alginate export family protein [Pseudomonas petrae]MCF7538471.1 alginate export family protein [Pseudomonas petrae]MCF7541407.1 alginate export family protein [Pseudomonas petrae]MCF7556174.1 alginate export family protein [Pseudomonas petrae]